VPKEKGKLFIISGPSGVGKDSVIEKAEELGLEFGRVITTTTRKPRIGEKEGKPYYFISKPQFLKLIKEGQFLEWAEVYGHYYGSTKKEVEKALADHKVMVMKVDPQGARAIKKMMPDAQTIFVVPPSPQSLAQRLKLRKTDSAEVIKKRLAVAKKEMKNLAEWNFVVINKEDKLKEAALKVKKIVEGSANRMLGRKILFVFLGSLIIFGYLFLLGSTHPDTKQTVRNLIQKITIPLEINNRIRQSQAMLNLLPNSAYSAFLVDFNALGDITDLIPAIMTAPNFDQPSISKALIVFQKNGRISGTVFKLENPVELNWERFQKAVKYFWASKYPSQETKTLSDNSEFVELVPDPEKIPVESSSYEGQEIIVVIGEEISLVYARVGNYAVLTANSSLDRSKQDIYQIIDANGKTEKRANLKSLRRCLEENSYQLTLSRSGISLSEVLDGNPILSLLFGQNKPKSEKCI